MKKVLSAVLAVLMAVSVFAGCGKKNDNKLVMATNATFPPYEYYEGEKMVGIDVEIAEKIAEKLGMELEVVNTEFGAIIAGVEKGKYDFGMAGMTVTEDRLKSVDFSNTYAHALQVVIVKEDSEITSVDDFYTGFDADGNPEGVVAGLKVAVQQDTTGDIYCSDTPDNWGVGEENVLRLPSGPDAVEALKAGKVSAVVIDNEPAKAYVAANKGLKILDGAYADEDYAICVKKGNSDLLNKINTALDELTKDGTIQKIVDKYIPAN